MWSAAVAVGFLLCSQSSAWTYPLPNNAFSRRLPLLQASSKGFGSSNSNDSKEKATLPPKQQKIFSVPALYDLAVGYRNYDEEVKFLVEAHEKYSGSPPKSALEVASGTSRHSITALKSGLIERATAIDLSPEMIEYSKTVASEELEEKSAQMQFLCDDMRSFQINGDETFDTSWILSGSLQHLATNDDVINCFNAIHKSLVPGGTLIVEVSHPSETFSIGDCTTNSWGVPLQDENGDEYGELKVIYGDEDDEFDPITQIRQFTMQLQLDGVEEAEKQSVRDIVPFRLFTSAEMDLFARCTGFELDAMFGALSDDVNVEDEDAAFRLVCVFRKR